MRPFFKLLLLTLFVLAALSAWVKYRQELTGTIQTLQIPAAETPTGDANATTNPPTPEPTGVDIAAPQIVAVDLVPAAVDTTAASQPLTMTVHITDDLSGLQRALLRFVPAQGGTQFIDFEITAGHRVRGDRRDGHYVTTALLPKYAAHGRWYLSEIMVTDNANNTNYGYSYGDDYSGGNPDKGVAELVRGVVAEALYFVNGEDSGPIVVPGPEPVETVPVEPGPLPPDGGPVHNEDAPGPNQLFMPRLGE